MKKWWGWEVSVLSELPFPYNIKWSLPLGIMYLKYFKYYLNFQFINYNKEVGGAILYT